jgi:serine/threonine protein kinase
VAAVGPSRPTDVYALATLCWEVLAAARPWDGYSATDRLAEIRENQLLDWSKLPGDVPATLRDLIMRGLAHSREARPTARELRDGLRVAREEIDRGRHDVFLSYAWGKENSRRPFALTIQRTLSHVGGLRVWFDWFDNRPDGSGEMTSDTKASMRKGVEGSTVAVVLMSPDYANSKNCRFELDAIREFKKPLVICLVEPGFWTTWLLPDGSRAVPIDNSVAKDSGLAAGRELFVDLGDVLNVLDASSIKALHHNPDKFPMLLRLVKEKMARASAASK